MLKAPKWKCYEEWVDTHKCETHDLELKHECLAWMQEHDLRFIIPMIQLRFGEIKLNLMK